MTVASVTSTNSTGVLSSAGIGSGLDVTGLVSKLMAVEQQPLTLLDTQEATYQAKLTSLGTVTGALASLQTAAQSLTSASVPKNSAVVSDSTVLSASASGSAQAGSYSVAVTTLAQAQTLLAAGQASSTSAIGSGASSTVSFSFGTIASALGPTNGSYSDATFTANASQAPLSIVIDSSNNTLAGIAGAINAAGAGVTAAIINDGSGTPYRLAITSASGVANSMKIAVSGDSTIAGLLGYDPSATQHLQQTQVAQNAALSVNGVNITSASNTVSGAIPGVTLNLSKQTAANSPVSVSVQSDTSSLNSAIGALVSAYNSAQSTISGVTAQGALLQGDWSVSLLQRQIISILNTAHNSGGAYTTLTDLGVTFQKDGTLAFDSTKANAALTADSAGVAALTSAIGKAVNRAAASLLGPTGPVAVEETGINQNIKDIVAQRINMQSRLALIQQTYQTQFNTLDTLLSSMTSTSNFLTQQLANLPAIANTTSKG